ncbi:MAG TPA: hypothetical protein VN025_13405 [Candidatus Dormibacteraeota bacterium]|jgi:hypothetical protein|nr:hypothetical protein [Candidatus Dormibacteraeota bacterium]
MKRSGFILAALLFVGGILRIGVPAPASILSKQESSRSAGIKKSHAPTKATPVPAISRIGYQADIERNIRESFGTLNSEKKTADPELAQFWGVPSQARLHSTHVIAILPDPIHTQLALFFDRSIESLQIAAQKQGYEFDRAILPWEREQHPESPDADVRAKTEAARVDREANPGLLIFREGSARRRVRIEAAIKALEKETAGPKKTAALQLATEQEAPLFVWVVGETPTSGIRKAQFEKARDIVASIRATGPANSSPDHFPLLILGPSFSGSLSSLRFELEQNSPAVSFIYSGTVTGSSAQEFAASLNGHGQFASFSENDDYLLVQFLEFAFSRGYKPEEVAVLSEDETAYGNISASFAREKPATTKDSPHPQPESPQAESCWLFICEKRLTARDYQNTLHLHFPREISQFRAAYQRQVAASSQTKSSTPVGPGVSALPLDLGETGSDDDTVAPYAPSQSTLSQEAVMLGIISSLQKHHSKFIVLFATDPLDELFLARYLRESYPQGRIVVTTPDLLSAREEDSLLHGVIGINTYPLLPGLNDRLIRPSDVIPSSHEDRIFVSSLSEGTFNAMAGLLSAADLPSEEWPKYCAKDSQIPSAPYADYGGPVLQDGQKIFQPVLRPLLWLTLLGRDGFWPVVGITPEKLTDADSELPVTTFSPKGSSKTTLKSVSAGPAPPDPEEMHTPGAWRIAYYLCLLIMVIQTWFSAKGTILSDSEAMAQFARATPPDRAKEKGESRGAVILAMGALCLSSAFTLVMCTRILLGTWTGGAFWALLLWMPLPAFTLATAWDLKKWRHAPKIAAAFSWLVLLLTCAQILLVSAPVEFLRYHRVYWSTRVLHYGSGVSPVLPVLLLAAAFYWWFWMSLRGVSLVDLRRPRLPHRQDLPRDAYRISDTEGERLRQTAYPLSASLWQIAPLIALAVIVFTLLDYGHPVQTIEGTAYDWGFTVVLAVLTWTFLATMLKLVRTWLETQQILSGLDRKAIREAFSRLKGFSWKPIWNPGGSTLRESYRVLSRAMENLERLHAALHSGNRGECLAKDDPIHGAILEVFDKRDKILDRYKNILPALSPQSDSSKAKPAEKKKWNWRSLLILKHDKARQDELDALLLCVEDLQLSIAKAAGLLIKEYLCDSWSHASELVASDDPRKEKPIPGLSQLLAEEYVSLVYVNFLVSALLRMRTLVYSAVGMYVLLLCSITVYPFEPHPALQAISVVALVVLGLAVGYVYSQMHRDAILSRLTETSAGELGWDFWIKFISAGAIPVLSLLAAQFPAINEILFSWLEPALQALK